MRSVWAYVDGYNLYCGLTDPKHYQIPNCKTLYRKNSWLNIETLISASLPTTHKLERIKYFTAMAIGADKSVRQDKYLKALKSIKILDPPYFGNIRTAGKHHSEKKTDIEIALNMYSDALNKDCYTIALITGDTDQVPTIEWIRRLNKDIEILIFFPPFRKSKELRSLADGCINITEKTAAGHQFPDNVQYEDNGQIFNVMRPSLWK